MIVKLKNRKLLYLFISINILIIILLSIIISKYFIYKHELVYLYHYANLMDENRAILESVKFKDFHDEQLIEDSYKNLEQFVQYNNLYILKGKLNNKNVGYFEYGFLHNVKEATDKVISDIYNNKVNIRDESYIKDMSSKYDILFNEYIKFIKESNFINLKYSKLENASRIYEIMNNISSEFINAR
ncbi:hypothetical protein [Thermoanaerobacterium thermosaccharolyticum]|uniref:Uncharacterized protein n=2 Tax=Thermoanaerobacterium thermosaccharolyticum TaxID=1517 RepID=D9TQS8_THETC|nr:hypothetical protein [Thermoanaerobacterium thermosaccharolyticum]ADL67904.1 hypothetical protein Tthe_0333 [Thermoanaerobacterium thermosaccharolyticum DSM 571]KAA5806941.1 hypothetical protein F1655_06800 [Thermoanaerobacterium thermosaccharolyticum]